MTVSETLKQTWDAVLAEASPASGCYHRRIPLAASWPAHAGIQRPPDARILILESEQTLVRALRLKDATKGYLIDVGPDEAGRTGRVAIRIQETSPAYREMFTVFCGDILENWIPQTNASDALNALGRRLVRWKRFFQRGGPFGLSREDYVGLYGELSFIEAGLRAGVGSLRIVNAWQGPIGANQDFLFGPVAVEVKTTTGNELDRVRITNARQLDSTGIETLFLMRYAFDFRQGSGRSLPQLVASLKASIAGGSSEVLSLFNERLLEAGFLDGTPNELDDWGFTLRRVDAFGVSDGFPRLLESSLPAGVTDVSYTLNLSTAAAFQALADVLWESIISSHG